MQNSKLYSILEEFDKYEQNRLRKFLSSPYFNRNEALIRLFDLLVAHINAKIKAPIEKEEVWQKLYGNINYDDVLFRKNCSDLLGLVESYLAQEVYAENPLYQATFLIEAVGRKKMEKLFNSTMKTARRLSDLVPFRSSEYYLSQFQIEKSFYEMSQVELNRSEVSNVETILNNLDSFYFAEKMRWFTSVLTQKFLTSHEYKLLFINEIIDHLKKVELINSPVIAIYFQIYLTIAEAQEEAHYFKLKDLLNVNGLKFPKSEAKNMYYSAINYCIRKRNIEGKTSFLRELLDLYKDLLAKEIIIDADGLSPWDFKNIVTCGTSIGEFVWTEKFISEYGKLIPLQYRENAISFNQAKLFFFQKRYNEMISLLQTVEYEDFSYNLDSKMFLLMTYFEIDAIEPLFSLLDSFRAYLNRHKDIPSSRRVSYSNLIRFTKQLTKITPGDKKAIEKLKKEIAEAEPKGIASLTWLREKIAELE